MIEALCGELASPREREGRLFIIGVGGSAGNCGHAVNDFRKLCGIEAYAPIDNVSELTARTNDVTGLAAKATVEVMHAEVRRRLPIDEIMVCHHVEPVRGSLGMLSQRSGQRCRPRRFLHQDE
jgi:hypothetical protein